MRGDVPTSVCQAAKAAFGCQVPGAEVLPLTEDVVVRRPLRARVMRFEGDGCTALVTVRGRRRLLLHVVIRPDDAGEVEVLQLDGAGQVRIRLRGGRRLVGVAPGLTSLFVRWPAHRGRAPVRTSWALL